MEAEIGILQGSIPYSGPSSPWWWWWWCVCIYVCVNSKCEFKYLALHSLDPNFLFPPFPIIFFV